MYLLVCILWLGGIWRWPEQSSIKFNTSDLWKEVFKTDNHNAYKGLRKARNLFKCCKYKTIQNFEEDTVQLALDVGLNIQILVLSLSTQQGGSTTTTLEGDSVDKKQENRYLGFEGNFDLSGEV
ncbi:MAG: hypothetical protein CM15mV8_1230 [Caudoviricetes sp.]|nr:MAG: hypothetical protein CM15mV8_1230 [Caudoviricetes sp.]